MAEALTNICSSRILRLEDVVLSANWMAAGGEPAQQAALYATVEAVSTLAQQLRIAIPVGKDSMSMSMAWTENGRNKQVTAPVSLNVTAYAPVADIRKTLTPQLHRLDDSALLLVDLGMGRNRLGGSALAQVDAADRPGHPRPGRPGPVSGLFHRGPVAERNRLYPGIP